MCVSSLGLAPWHPCDVAVVGLWMCEMVVQFDAKFCFDRVFVGHRVSSFCAVGNQSILLSYLFQSWILWMSVQGSC